MTSKVALDKLVKCCLTKEYVDVESTLTADKLRDVVEKDLDILDMIKYELRHNNVISKGRLQELCDWRCSELKEWLGNDD